MSPEQLAEDHWAYVYATLVAHGCEEGAAVLCGYHYKTAFVHGYKHAVEDMEPVVLSHSKRREDESQRAVDEATHNINEFYTMAEYKK